MGAEQTAKHPARRPTHQWGERFSIRLLETVVQGGGSATGGGVGGAGGAVGAGE